MESPKFDLYLEPVLTEKELEQQNILKLRNDKVQKDVEYCMRNFGKKRLIDNSVKKLGLKPN